MLTQMLLKIAAVLSLETWVVFGKHLVLASLNGSKLSIAEELNSRNLGKVCVLFLSAAPDSSKETCLLQTEAFSASVLIQYKEFWKKKVSTVKNYILQMFKMQQT